MTTRRLRLLPLALFSGALLLYLATLTQVHTFDALSYVTSVERKPWQAVFHPHHLAYGPLGALALAAGRALGYGGGAALPMQLVNATAGALGVALFFSTARRAAGRADTALAAALLLGAAYAYWYYAVEIEVYTVAALFLIACMAIMARADAQIRAYVLLGLAQGGAVLFHQTNLLLCVPVLVWHLGMPGRGNLRNLAAYGLAFALAVGPPYLWVAFGVSGFRTVDEFVGWTTEYARTGWWGGPLTARKLADLGQGLSDTLAQPFGGWLWLALGAIALPWDRARRWRGAARGRGDEAPRRWWLVAWLLVYGGFFLWWEPDNVEFWIASLPPALLLYALALGGARQWGARIWAALLVAALVGGVNYDAIRRRGDAATDLQRTIARALVERSTPADLLVVPDGLLELYLPYYEGHENFASLNQALFDAGGSWDAACATLRGRIDTALHAGASAIIADEALSPPQELLERHRLAQAQVEACFAPYAADLVPLELPPEVPRYARLPTGQERAEGDGWLFDTSTEGWRAANVGPNSANVDADGWAFIPGVDPALTSPLMSLEASRFRAIEIRMANATGARDAQLFFAGPDGQIAEERSLRWELAPIAEATTYTLELRGAPGWQGTITRLRIDPVGVGDGGEVRVEWIRLLR